MLKKLQAKAKELKAKNDALLAKVEKEDRSMNDDERAEFNNTFGKINDLIAQIEDFKKMQEAQSVIDSVDSLVDDDDKPVNDFKNIQVRDVGPKWKNGFGEMLQCVARAARGGEVDNRLVNAAGTNTQVGSEGGFLVETDHATDLIQRTYETSALASRCQVREISANSNRYTQNYIDETSRATGSRLGGIQGYWIDEAGTITPSKPKFGQIDKKLGKLAGLIYATEEMMQDGVALNSMINAAFPEEFAWLLDDAIFNGDGVGKPEGILSHAATVSVAKESGQTADTIVFQNISKMWSRMWAPARARSVWVINQDVEQQLQSMSLAVGTGGVPVYMPAGGISNSPFSTLYGRPVIPIEQCKTIGDKGDIALVDMSQYLLIQKGGIRMDESIHVQFLTDQRAFRFIYRVNGLPLWKSALTPANGSNTLSPFVVLDARG